MAIDMDALLAPVAEENPVGPDLSYDPERQQIEAAFDISVGDEQEGAEVNWREIIGLIEAQSLRTKDLWLPVYLCRAGARARRLEVVETGAQYLAGLLEQYWERVHPELEEYGFQGRRGACESLTRIGEFINPLRRVILVRHPRLGEYSGADFERFREGAEAEDGYGLFRAALEDLGEEPITEVLGSLDAIAEGIRRADNVLTVNAGDETGTNFKATYDAIASIRRGVAHFHSGNAGEAEEGASGASGTEAPAPQPGASGGQFAGRIDSREDVVRALEAIGDYYRRREPGSPVPLALARARDWVNADFLTVLEDIAPGGMDEVRRVLMPSPRSEE
jgi:type VI secretion system protein ImpA